MKTKLLPSMTTTKNLTETKFKRALAIASQLLSRAACLGAVILICSSASAQNLFVSGSDARGGEIFKFNWDGEQSIFATGFVDPWDLAFDSAGNLFVLDYSRTGLLGNAVIYKISPTRIRTIFASGLSYPSDLAVDRAANLFVADYDHGIIYKYKSDGSRAIFASGLYHPIGLVFDSAGNLFVADNNIGNIHQGSIYKYKPDGSRLTFAVLERGDRPADLALNSVDHLFMADRNGNIYKYENSVSLGRYRRTTFGFVPYSAQSLAFDSAGDLLVVDAGDLGSTGTAKPNAIYRFSQQGVRSTFARGSALGETFSHVASQTPVCCQ